MVRKPLKSHNSRHIPLIRLELVLLSETLNLHMILFSPTHYNKKQVNLFPPSPSLPPPVPVPKVLGNIWKNIGHFIYFIVYCALTLPSSLERMFLSEIIYAFINIFNMQMRSCFHNGTGFITYIPNVQMRKRRHGSDSAAHHELCWMSARAPVRSTWLNFYSALLLRSYCSEHVLWVSCLSLSWGKNFFLFAFSTFFSN